jgi:hypothetical protein
MRETVPIFEQVPDPFDSIQGWARFPVQSRAVELSFFKTAGFNEWFTQELPSRRGIFEDGEDVSSNVLATSGFSSCLNGAV